jgi:hypothetical protein
MTLRRALVGAGVRLEDRDVVAPVVAELEQLCRNHLARIVTLAAERDAGVSGVVPADTLLLCDRALQPVEELLRARARETTLQIDRAHRHGRSIADRVSANPAAIA